MQRLENLRMRLKRGDRRQKGVKPENIVWMFGTGRTGSTWLASMMEEFEDYVVWREPLVGELFGNLYYLRAKNKKRNSKHFILGRHKNVWLRSIRNFVLEGIAAIFPSLTKESFLVVKEPNGSVGAPLIMEAFPESRMILLVRDPRDVIASVLDSRRRGGWASEKRLDAGRGNAVITDEESEAFVRGRADLYLRDVSRSKEAYDAHEGPKTLVCYEDLVADTLEEMRRIYRELGIDTEERVLARVVEKHSWDNIPVEKKGPGKFYRKASPGGWREDLTREQVRMVEEITASVAGELYFR